MATAWHVGGNNSSNYYTHDLWVNLVGQDINANTSTFSWHYDVTFNKAYQYGGWTQLHNTHFHVYINGADQGDNTPNFDFRHAPRTITMVSGQTTVANNSDGSLNIGLRMTASAIPGSANFTAVDFSSDTNSSGGPVNVIPRASSFTLTPGSGYPGDIISLAITRASGSFTHTVDVTVAGGNVLHHDSIGTSDSFTIDEDWLGGLTRAVGTVTLATYSGATLIGSPVSHDFVMLTPPDYPEIGQGTPYDIRIRRMVVEDSKLVPKEIIPFQSVDFTDTMSASGSLTLTTSNFIYETNLDEHVVLIDVFDGAQWLSPGIIQVLTRTEDDLTDESDTTTYTGQSYADYLLSKLVVAGDYQWPSANAGWIISQYMNEGQSRGWGPFIERDFDYLHTTGGSNWQQPTAPNVTKNTPVSQLLSGFVDDVLAEYGSSYNPATGKVTIHMYNPGYGVDWASTGANPIVNLATTALFKVASKAPVRKDFSNKLTRVNVSGDESAQITRENGSSVNPILGHLEGTVSASGVTDPNQLAALGDATLTANATAIVERTYSYDLSSTQTAAALYPYRTFRPGDFVLVPEDVGLLRLRVSQVAISKDSDSTTATITVGDLIPSGVAATARKLAQTGGGAIGGGTLRAPLPLSAAIPQAPDNLEGVSTGYWATDGSPLAGVALTWTPVTQSVAGGSINVDFYEIWTRDELGTPWSLATTSSTPDVTVGGLETNKSFDFYVRARSVDGIYGSFSDILTVITAIPETDIPGPDLADLYTDGVGGIYAVWGGTLDNDPAPLKLGYVVAEISSDAGATYTQAGTPIVAAGTIVINPGAYGDYLVRLRAYDKLGNPGDASDPQDIATVDPHINPPRPLPPTDLAAVAGASWDASGFLPTAWFDLTWTAPTEDEDGNAITAVGFDVYGMKQGETIQRFLTSVTSPAARITVGNGESWTFQVTATSNFGGVSAASDPLLVTADATIPATAAPTEPTLSQYAGILQIKWDGGGMVPQIKFVYATISQTSGGTYTRAGMILQGAGEIDVPGLAPGDYYAKITMVDELGNTVTSAAAGPITLLPITGVTYQTSPLPNTGIKIDTGSLTAYNASGNPTFILNANTGEVWIAPYDAVFDLGATGTVQTTGAATTGIAISAENSDFNTFINPSGLQIRRGQTALSWWEADASDASLVNFFSPRVNVGQRLRIGDHEMKKEAKTTGSRVVLRYGGA